MAAPETRAHRAQLAPQTIHVSQLTPAMRDAAYALFEETYTGADRARFDRDLDAKQLMILLRDRRTGALKGFSSVQIERIPEGGTVIFSGDTAIHRDYWGQKQLQIAFARILLLHKLRAPHQPVYWLLISKGYRTYLLFANAFRRAVPRHDLPDDHRLRALLSRLATARFGPDYDAVQGVIRYRDEHERVRPGLAPITARHMDNPHVRFFVDRNPGHERGHELACIAEVRFRDLIGIGFRLVLALTRNLTARRPRPASRGWPIESRETA